MITKVSGVIIEIIRQALIFAIALYFWVFEAAMFEEIIHDSSVSRAGVIVPHWYQLSVYYVFPILILIFLFLALQKFINSLVRKVSALVCLVLTIDVIYLAFSLPGFVASKIAQQNISNHVLSIRDMAGFILINLCILIGLIFWQRSPIREAGYKYFLLLTQFPFIYYISSC